MEDKDIFENIPELDVNAESEMKAIRKTIRNRSWKTVAISVVLVLSLLLTGIYGVMPAVEKSYWNPYDGTVGEGVRDLDLVLSAYTELFQPGWKLDSVGSGRIGFATYDLSIIRSKVATGEDSFMTGSLRKNDLGWDYRFSAERATRDLFRPYVHVEYAAIMSGDSQYQTDARISLNAVETLKKLPDYLTIEAAVCFQEDITMEQLLTLREEYDLPISWIAICNDNPEEYSTPLCGMNPFYNNTIYYEVNEKYPHFGIDLSYETDFRYSPEHLEQHFRSLLQLSSDMLEKGRGARVYGGERNFYRETLDYVEENGIKSYGIIVFADAPTLLALLENDLVADINFLETWIDLW